MDFIKRGLPSRREIFVVFLVIIFPVNFWSLIFFFRELPSYLMRMRLWDILGVLAYTQVVAVLDSLLLLALLFGAAFLLPNRIFKDHFIPVGSLTSLAAVLGVIPLHYRIDLLQSFPYLKQPWAIWGWVGFLLLLLALSIYFVIRSPAIERGLRNFLDKLTVLSSLYLALNAAAILVVIVRNLGLN